MNGWRDEIKFYAPYHYVKKINDKYLSEFKQQIIETSDEFVVEVNQYPFVFYIQKRAWDSAYFSYPTYKLNFVQFDTANKKYLIEACHIFIKQFLSSGKYIFIEIPSEDIQLIQALNSVGFALIETRLHYHHHHVQSFQGQRFEVRKANEDDIPLLKMVASSNSNPFDRVHADPFYSTEVANKYLGDYIENSIRGFADVVLMPDLHTNGAAFYSMNYQKNQWSNWGVNIAHLPLAAVDSSMKGWHKKLTSELIFSAQKEGVEVVSTTTQSTNKAVIHNLESLGFKLGTTTHILSTFS